MKLLNLSLLFLTFFYSSITFAQPIANVFVFSEKGNERNEKCNVSYESAVAAVKASLRYNRVPVVATDTSPFSLYINLNNHEFSSRACSIAINLHVYFYAPVNVPYTNKKPFLKTMLCERTTAGVLDKINQQSSINTELKSMVEECLASIENTLSK